MTGMSSPHSHPGESERLKEAAQTGSQALPSLIEIRGPTTPVQEVSVSEGLID